MRMSLIRYRGEGMTEGGGEEKTGAKAYALAQAYAFSFGTGWEEGEVDCWGVGDYLGGMDSRLLGNDGFG